ncbi:hypothetical protein [Spirochaeta cellobiosiphila]|uniref:hypothetical protein n=1 Tax=Spirochaeta cellobiosiphila TaxID=504483 RepID=UPI0003FA2F73|nr:hypothetical protein [Spirochaeta cellobiosiphila]
MGFDIASFLGVGKTIKDGAEGIGSATEQIIYAGKGKLPPEEQVKIEQIKSQAEGQMWETISKMSNSFQNFTLKYEGEAKDLPRPILLARSLVRPLFTYLVLGQVGIIFGLDFWRYMKGTGAFELVKGMPSEWWVMVWIVIGFYFGERAVTNALSNSVTSKK